MDKKTKFKIKFLIKVILLSIIVSYLLSYMNLSTYISILESNYYMLLTICVLFIGTLIFLDISLELLRKFFEQKGDFREYPIVSSVFRYVTWFVAILIGLSIVYQGLGSLVMSLGLIGAGITFALQQPILNFAGWITIVTMKPFKLNDRINISGVGAGDVYKIDVMHIYLSEVSTSLRVNVPISNMDGEPTGKSLIIPNSTVLTTPITNYTKGSPYIWDGVYIPITYESNIEKAEQIIFNETYKVVGKEMERLAEIWSKRPRKFGTSKPTPKPLIRVFPYDNGLIIKARYLVKAKEWAEIKTEITRNIILAIQKEKDVRIAYPHLEIKYNEENSLSDKLNEIINKDKG